MTRYLVYIMISLVLYSCSKNNNSNINKNIVTINAGNYQASVSENVDTPFMYTHSNVITNGQIIKDYLNRKKILDSFEFDKNQIDLGYSLVRLTLLKPILYDQSLTGYSSDINNADGDSIHNIGGSYTQYPQNEVVPILKVSLSSNNSYTDVSLNQWQETIIYFRHTYDSTIEKNIPQSDCIKDISYYRSVPQYNTYLIQDGKTVPDTTYRNENGYGYLAFPLLFKNPGLELPLMTWTVSTASGCTTFVRNEWNLFNFDRGRYPTIDLPVGDTLVVQQGYVTLNQSVD